MNYIETLIIKKFKGIEDLEIDNLQRINLIVGDNNSGKTSVLEAIQLFANPTDIYNVYKVANSRNARNTIRFSQSLYNNFRYLFPANEKVKSIEASCFLKNSKYKSISLKIGGMDIKTMFLNSNNEDNDVLPFLDENNQTNEFVGNFVSIIDGKKYTNKINLNQGTRIEKRIVRNQDIKITYESPMAHFYEDTFNAIIKNEKYKNICVNLLKLFDEDIEDILYTKDEVSYYPIESIKHKKNGIMPLSTYGDGIKKALLLANSIAKSANGILLIDEIDTSIHSRFYDDIFKFLNKASKQYSVQLFITTHSIEAVDSILSSNMKNGEYDINKEAINVITLRKDSITGKTHCRTLSGSEVKKNRSNFEFEVRL